MKENRGVTLIELIISMALLGIVLTTSFSMFSFGNTVHRMSISEYDVQAATRLVSEHTNRIARFSTAVFTIPESIFRENNLTNGWSYVGVLNGEVVVYEYGLIAGVVGHHKKVLAAAHPNIDYKIAFKKANEDHEEKIVSFSIQGFIKNKPIELDTYGNPIGHINILSQVEALNSLQVIHKGVPGNPAVALAYRTDNRDGAVIEVNRPVAQVAMVLDTSGSMNWQMNGNTTNNNALRRITIMKAAAQDLITKFAASEYPVDISLVPFSTHANGPRAFKNAQTQTADLSSDIIALVADGGTNTGDGIRRAYHQILDNSSNPNYDGKIISNYIIILVDGVTTFATRTGKTTSFPYRTDNLDIPSPFHSYSHNDSHIHGSGSSLDAQGTAYVNTIGNLVKNNSDANIKVFVIGFSSKTSDLASVDDIVSATGARPKFLAGNYEELGLAFGEIQKSILNELWYIDGPDLSE